MRPYALHSKLKNDNRLLWHTVHACNPKPRLMQQSELFMRLLRCFYMDTNELVVAYLKLMSFLVSKCLLGRHYNLGSLVVQYVPLLRPITSFIGGPPNHDPVVYGNVFLCTCCFNSVAQKIKSFRSKFMALCKDRTLLSARDLL